jgi:hypothetical protein
VTVEVEKSKRQVETAAKNTAESNLIVQEIAVKFKVDEVRPKPKPKPMPMPDAPPPKGSTPPSIPPEKP